MTDNMEDGKRKRTVPSSSSLRASTKHYCDTCKVHCPNDQTLVQHNKGKKHTNAVSDTLKREQHALRSIFVGDLPKAAKLASAEELKSGVVQPEKLKEGLMAIFSKFGDVTKMLINKDHAHYCIIEYKSPSMANAALSAFKLGQIPVFYEKQLKIKSRNQTKIKLVGEINLPNELQQDNIIALLEEADEPEFGLALVDSALVLTDVMRQGRIETCNRLQTQISQNLPFFKISLDLYGSSGSGLALADSDLDLSISVMDGKRLQRDDLVSILKQKCPGVSHVHVIPGPCGKITRFLDGISNTMCDILFANKLGLTNTELISLIISTDKRIARLIRLVNFWCRVNINARFPKQKTISSYALTMMVIHYLMEVDCVPTFFGEEAEKKLIFDIDCSFIKDMTLLPKTSNIQTIAQLLKGFFEYYGQTFEFENHIVQVRNKSKLERKIFDTNAEEMETSSENKNYVTTFKLTPLCVQDPLVQTHNIAHNVTDDVLVMFVDCCRSGLKNMVKGEELDKWLFSGGLKKVSLREKKDSSASMASEKDTDSSMTEKDSSMTEKDSSLTEKDSSLTEKDSSLMDGNSSYGNNGNYGNQAGALPGMKRSIEELEIGS